MNKTERQITDDFEFFQPIRGNSFKVSTESTKKCNSGLVKIISQLSMIVPANKADIFHVIKVMFFIYVYVNIQSFSCWFATEARFQLNQRKNVTLD